MRTYRGWGDRLVWWFRPRRCWTCWERYHYLGWIACCTECGTQWKL